MTVMSWLRLTISLWLIRKMVKVTGWLLLFLLAMGLWPVTLVTAAGYPAASRRGWPPAQLRRAAAASLLTTAVWLAAALRPRTWRTAALAPPRTWAYSWHHLAALAAARVFLLAGPGRDPGRASPGRRAVVLAELRDHGRDRRPVGLGAGHLRRPPVAPPGPRRSGQDRRAWLRPPASQRRAYPGRRHHPRGRLQVAARPHRPGLGVRAAHGHHRRRPAPARRT